jgi:hypothetical protein
MPDEILFAVFKVRPETFADFEPILGRYSDIAAIE